METKSIWKVVSALAVTFSGLFFFACVKEGTNATLLNRSLAATDSTVFAQYYDTSIIAVANTTPGINDVIHTQGVASIIENRCATTNCHGGGVGPTLKKYADVKALVTDGNPEGSKLWELVTTNNFQKAMPPVNHGSLTTTEKVIVYNWIKNGAKERPALEDYRPAAIHLIVSGCASVQCHSAPTLVADWGKKGLLGTLTASDTIQYNYGIGTATVMSDVKTAQIWGAYKDSVWKFYGDTIANASFRPFKTLSTPWTIANKRSPLNSYNDILMDILYPKSVRTNSSPVYTSPGGAVYYSRSNYLNSTDCFIRRIDSTLIYTNQETGLDGNYNGRGNMTYDDSHWTPSEIALVKAWYFADPNIPDAWKYGKNNQGIFRSTKAPQTKIVKK